MESSGTITVRFKFSRVKFFLLVAFFFFVWRPGFLGGSEILKLTTYYPAPYGGYVKFLVNGDTLLARDGGVVGIGVGSVPSVHDQSNTKLYVNGEIAHTGGIAWGGYQSILTPDQGGSIEMGGANGMPHIDFKKTNEDYSNRIIMGANSLAPTRLNVTGDFEVMGTYQNACEYRNFNSTSVTYCGGSAAASINYNIMGVYDSNGNDQRLNMEYLWFLSIIYSPQSGKMLCCKFSAP